MTISTETNGEAEHGPLVSIVMCAYNAGAYLIPALRSALGQTYRNFELLVIDDGSTDGSVDAAQQVSHDPRIRWFRQINAGKPAAMNFGISQARGEFYAIQDADDLSDPRRIATLVETMRQHPECAGVFSGHELILDDRRMAPTFRTKTSDDCRRDIERMAMPAHDPTAMYRLSMVRQFEYEPSLHQGEGLDYILRVGERYPLWVVGECLYSYRIHWASLTRSDPEGRRQCVREVHRRACVRRGMHFDEFTAVKTSRKRQSRHSNRDNGLASHFINSVQDQRNRGQLWSAFRTGLQCACLHPMDLEYLKATVYSVSPDWLRMRVKSYRS